MRPLDYEPGPVRGPQVGWTTALLLAILPVAATLLPLIALVNWLNEPFGVATAFDLAVFVGGPVVVVGSAIGWCVLAIKSRILWTQLGPALLWFALMGYGSISLMRSYFREPWNY